MLFSVRIKRLFSAFLAAAAALSATASDTDSLFYSATAIGGGASREFNPYMLGSWNYGRTVAANNALLDLSVIKPLDLGRRFSWSAGVEALGGYASKADYRIWDADAKAYTVSRQGPPAAWLQQLYASVKFRGVFLTAGLKEEHSPLVDERLSSGDLVHSNNARPVAQVRVGFVDFQNIPFTRGWAQIEGVLAYGRMCQGKYLENRFNRYNGIINTGSLYTYKRIYFRSKPTEPLVVTIGMQSGGLFGGTTSTYAYGVKTQEIKYSRGIKAFWNMLFPTNGNDGTYYEGSSLGSWDFRASYRFRGGHTLTGYFQWLWEDGSSMAKRNKSDGLWGIRYTREDGRRHLLEGAVAEYIDFRDQSGPLHYAPGDWNADIPTVATGGDNYYNNDTQNSWAHFGMSMGTPFVLSPVYNLDGSLQFKHTRSRGFHAAACGSLSQTVGWKAAVWYAVAWGVGRFHYPHPLHNTSAMFKADYRADALLRGLSASAALAFDAGSLRGNNWGALFTITYSGSLVF